MTIAQGIHDGCDIALISNDNRSTATEYGSLNFIDNIKSDNEVSIHRGECSSLY